jgi:pimeloyl-ACP methyl ester carboxylesterase
MKLGTVAFWIGSAIALSACGGGDDNVAPVDPLARHKKQNITWRDWNNCKDDVQYGLPDDIAKRTQCADIRVPLDYARPAQEDIVISLVRIRATNPQQKIGTLIMNPGGPGNDGLWQAPQLANALSASEDENASSTDWKPSALLERYDLVSFSPRGAGSSSRLYCSSNKKLRLLSNSSAHNAADVDAIMYNARTKAEACEKQPLARHINTDAMARDLDILRELMGDTMLNYIGFSSGTWLGQWYAGLFPDRIGRMVLDSSWDFTSTWANNRAQQAAAAQYLFDSILAPLAARFPEEFNLGATADEVRQTYAALSPRMKRALAGNEINRLGMYGRQRWVDPLIEITAAKGLETLIASTRADPDYLNPRDVRLITNKAIQYKFSDDTVATANALAAAVAVYGPDNPSLLQRYAAQTPISPWDPNASAVELKANSASRQTIACNDTPIEGSEKYWLDFASKYPIWGEKMAEQPCLYWGGPNVGKPAMHSVANAIAKAGGLLMVQNEFDSSTPAKGAMVTFEALPSASMILVKDEFGHGVFPYGKSCVDEPVVRYFLTGALPSRKTTCAAKPLGKSYGGVTVETQSG